MKLSNNKILITGGATGIGLALAVRFIEENNTVIICGRRASALQEAAEKFPALITRVCDVANAEERENLLAWIAAEHKDLNVLVINRHPLLYAGIVDQYIQVLMFSSDPCQ